MVQLFTVVHVRTILYICACVMPRLADCNLSARQTSINSSCFENRRYFRFLDSSDRLLFNCTVNLLFTSRQRRKYFVETFRLGKEHIPHFLVVAPQGGQSFRWWNQVECAGFRPIVICPGTAEELTLPFHHPCTQVASVSSFTGNPRFMNFLPQAHERSGASMLVPQDVHCSFAAATLLARPKLLYYLLSPHSCSIFACGKNAPGRTRTCNLVVRSHALYPIALRALKRTVQSLTANHF